MCTFDFKLSTYLNFVLEIVMPFEFEEPIVVTFQMFNGYDQVIQKIVRACWVKFREISGVAN